MKFDHLGLQIMSSCIASWILHDGSIIVTSLDPDSRSRKRTEAEAEPWRSRIWSINIHSIIFMQSSASSTEAACPGQSLAHVFSLYCLWELGHPPPVVHIQHQDSISISIMVSSLSSCKFPNISLMYLFSFLVSSPVL